MGGFSVYRGCKGIVWSWPNYSVQEGNGTIVHGIFYGKLDMRVTGINVLEELTTLFSLLDDKGVNHISKPKPEWNG